MEHTVIWSPGISLESLEQMVIVKAYKFYRHNKTATANALGISIRTLDNKLERYEAESIQEAINNDNRQREREIQLARSRGLPVEQRVSVESAPHVAAQQSMPVQERAQVQEMLPKQFASRNTGNRRA